MVRIIDVKCGGWWLEQDDDEDGDYQDDGEANDDEEDDEEDAEENANDDAADDEDGDAEPNEDGDDEDAEGEDAEEDEEDEDEDAPPGEGVISLCTVLGTIADGLRACTRSQEAEARVSPRVWKYEEVASSPFRLLWSAPALIEFPNSDSDGRRASTRTWFPLV